MSTGKYSAHHEFEILISATRALVNVLRRGRARPGHTSSNPHFINSVTIEIRNRTRLIDFWYTRDPSTNANLRLEQVSGAIYELYQSLERPDVRSEMLRLWSLYFEQVRPRVEAAQNKRRLPEFSDDELKALEFAADELEKCTLTHKARSLEEIGANRIAPEIVIEIGELGATLLRRVTATPLDESDSIVLTYQAACAAWRLERLVNPHFHPYADKRRGLWGQPARIPGAIRHLVDSLSEIYCVLDWQGVCTAKSDLKGSPTEPVVGGLWWNKPGQLDLPSIDAVLSQGLRKAIADLCAVARDEYGDVYHGAFTAVANKLSINSGLEDGQSAAREMNGDAFVAVCSDNRPSAIGIDASGKSGVNLQALADAREAWEAGFSIVATKLNEVLAKHELSIHAAAPQHGLTLNRCRHVFNDCLRRSLTPMPEGPILPWSLGFVNDTTNHEWLIGLDSGGAEIELSSTIDFLRTKQWNKSQWENLIALPVERHAEQWRKWFRERSAVSNSQINDCAHAALKLERENKEQQLVLTSFSGGMMEFFPNCVKLCGVDICSGPRSQTKRRILELLGKKRSDRTFIAYSSEQLADGLGPKGVRGTVSGAIRDLRDEITRRLQKGANIVCGRNDVILSGGPGYRFSEVVSVQDEGRGAPNEITDMDGEGDVPNVRNVDVRNVRDVEASGRRKWILERLVAGDGLQAPHVAKQFNCSVKTAQRDLQALKDEGQIEFIGSPRTGYYRIVPKVDPS